MLNKTTCRNRVSTTLFAVPGLNSEMGILGLELIQRLMVINLILQLQTLSIREEHVGNYTDVLNDFVLLGTQQDHS